MINERFYKREHFVWCSPVYDPKSLGRTDPHCKIPDSSSPKKIYEILKNDIETGDRHSAKISTLTAGLNKAVDIKLIAGIIDIAEADNIREMIKLASLQEFKPMLMIIPMYPDLEKRLTPVPVDKAANPLSIEYQISDLRSDEFEIIMY